MRLVASLTWLLTAIVATRTASSATIYDLTKTNPAFSTLGAAIDAAGLTDILSEPGNYTVLGPTNAAFAKLALLPKYLEPNWYQHLQDVLLFHTLPLPLFAIDGLSVETLNGESITVNLDPPRIEATADGNIFSDIVLNLTDIAADNGVVHALHAVLLPTSARLNIVELLVQANPTDDFTILVDLVVAAGLVEFLSDAGPYTLFAPTDEAMAKLPNGTVESLMMPENVDTLIGILFHHVVASNVYSADLVDGPVVTLNDEDVSITLDPVAMVNDATIVGADVLGSNGVIHAIDTVLLPPAEPTPPSSGMPTAAVTAPDNQTAASTTSMPTTAMIAPDTPTAAPAMPTAVIVPETPTVVTAATNASSIYDIVKSDPDLSNLVSAIDAVSGLNESLSGPNTGNFTLFASADWAGFDTALLAKYLEPDWEFHLQDLLQYNMLGMMVYAADLLSLVDGQTVETLNGESITVNLDPPRINGESNIIGNQTDIYAANGVIHYVDKVLLPTSATTNIVQSVQDDPTNFSILADLVIAAGLAETLSGPGPLTLFAPTNDAMSKLPAGTIDSLKLPENLDRLVSILSYHVVDSNVLTLGLGEGPVTTLEGGTLETIVSADPPALIVSGATNDATIVYSSLLSNGVLHAVDSVLLPEEEEKGSIYEYFKTNPDFSTLGLALDAAGLSGVLSGPAGTLSVFAPGNSAFGNLDPEIFSKYLGAEWIYHLQDMILYHTLGSVVYTTDLSLGAMVLYLACPLGENALTGSNATGEIDIGNEVVDFSYPNGCIMPSGCAFKFEEGMLEDEQCGACCTSPMDECGSCRGCVCGLSVTDPIFETLNGEYISIELDPPRINNSSKIIMDLTDIEADNGVIHVIEDVLLPASASFNIVQLAQANPDFSILVDLVVSAGLAETLSGPGPFTLFAPTNDAFDNLPSGSIDMLKMPESADILSSILMYHVVPSIVHSNDFLDEKKTLQGGMVIITADPPMVEDASIVAVDILGSNGIVHAIDSVLTPADPTPVPSGTPSVTPTVLPTSAPVTPPTNAIANDVPSGGSCSSLSAAAGGIAGLAFFFLS